MLGIVDDPAGVVEKTDTRTITNGGPEQRVDETRTYKNKVKFNVQFAKNFWDFTIRGGLIENSGGVGFDYGLLGGKLKISLEAFEFSSLNLRAQAQYNIWKGVYALAGYSDILNKQDKRSNYLGAGLFLTNDDLKILLTQLPTSK
jgi:phospholipid/cholesterol/gamma-HCH transport system substrate-binding protein